MSRFFSEKYSALVPYTPGEQPKDMKYIKLNTNESPFAPSQKCKAGLDEAFSRLMLYPDPECRGLVSAAAEVLGVGTDEIIMTNGSDEILNFAFMAYCDKNTPAVFADITYGFYKVFADINNVPARIIPLKSDLTIDPEDYCHAGGTVFIANPNAPTGIALTIDEIEYIIKNNPDNVVVVDEAYIDFGGESAVSLIGKYDNLLVTQTFSKSRSMAGARLGFGVGSKELIRDINTIKYSTNPYNIDAMTAAVGEAMFKCEDITRENCRTIIENREWTKKELSRLGFEYTPSLTNFVFAKHSTMGGEYIYKELRKRGILVRYFSVPRIKDYNRITVGSLDQMKALIEALSEIAEEYNENL
ncbi:MAG: histidinol-phosphate transaminase [Ruminococcaceae bacterium]|nr:histidinol-phosphate transaminase [Oscillospiraceae bacterium]